MTIESMIPGTEPHAGLPEALIINTDAVSPSTSANHPSGTKKCSSAISSVGQSPLARIYHLIGWHLPVIIWTTQPLLSNSAKNSVSTRHAQRHAA
jgi:hypothetical protein